MSVILDVEGLCKSYGPLEVLKNVSFTVAEGETFAVIGPNGAGKTTLFKALTGESLPQGGKVRWAGRDVTRLPTHERARLGFGRTFQVARVFPELTAFENVVVAVEARLRAAGEQRGTWYRSKPSRMVRDSAEALLEDVGLSIFANHPAQLLSHGDKKRLELAVTLGGRPKILMLDEPTAGMSPSDRTDITALVARIRGVHGITVVMTEHDMDVIFGLAHRLMVMNYGSVIAIGDPAAVRANPTVREVYLGREMSHA